MKKTYQILLTLNVPRPSMNSQGLYTNDELTIKEAIYSYLEELIEDDTLYFKEMEDA
jgi:hypothetical protein